MKILKKISFSLMFLFLFAAVLYAQDEPELVTHDIESEEEIIKPYDRMPRFPGCEEEKESKRSACADKKMLQYIYSKVKYPQVAKDNGKEGTVVTSFTIQEDGTLKDIKIKRDIGLGCGDAVVKVLEEMNTEGVRWIPALKDGKPVPIQFNLPFKFRLSESEKAKANRAKKKKARKKKKTKS